MDGYRDLLQLLGADDVTSADRYLLLRSKLAAYFEGRRISPAEDYADEVLHRVAAKLASGEKILDINRYVYGIARYVRLESYRAPEMVALDDEQMSGDDPRVAGALSHTAPTPGTHDHGDRDAPGVLQRCVNECLEALSTDHQNLILAYYDADEGSGKHIQRRKELAKQNNKSAGALHKQICVLRQKIGNCARECTRREWQL